MELRVPDLEMLVRELACHTAYFTGSRDGASAEPKKDQEKESGAGLLQLDGLSSCRVVPRQLPFRTLSL